MKLNKIMLTLAGTASAFAFAASTPTLVFGATTMSARSAAISAARDTQSSSSSLPAQHASIDAASKDKTLLAAAEPFENLTEMAFSSNWSKIDQTIGNAERAATGARKSLALDAAKTIDGHLAAMTAARQKHDRANLALSSIEVYRILVSSVSAGTRTPVQVSLLDYSGFRYDADLKSSPIRWDDMNRAVAFSRQQWAVVAPRLKDPALAARFEKAVDGMDHAAQHKNSSLAAASVRSESDLVDELENYFQKH